MAASDNSAPRAPTRKTHRIERRPPFERIALVLQGGGALGAYQGGVYQALAEANLHPDWVAGMSIGAVNSALVAGNPPEKRVERLREFWEIVSTPPFGVNYLPLIEITDEFTHRWVNELSSLGALLGGAPGFFKPRVPPPFPLTRGSPDVLSYYDVGPLRATLERLVDFDLINSTSTRFSVGAVNVRTGNLVCFDNTTHDIGPEHIMASGSLPPGLPATEIEGEHYWDGGLVSNTPLEWVLSGAPRQDTLAFQIDLWSASGQLPGNLIEFRRAPEGHPVFEPHAGGHQSIQESAALAQGDPPPPQKAFRRIAATAGSELSRRRGRRESLQHHQSHLPHQKLRGCVARL